MTRDPGGFRAQHDGHCEICDEWFARNTLIMLKAGRPCHIECWKAAHE